MADFNNIPVEHTPVLIIGASMVGMTLSALLAKHGVKGCIAVERHASTAIHPRAAYFHRECYLLTVYHQFFRDCTFSDYIRPIIEPSMMLPQLTVSLTHSAHNANLPRTLPLYLHARRIFQTL